MSYALGTATGRIEIEYDGTGVKDAEADVEGLKGSSAKALEGLNTLGNTAGVAGGAIAAGLAVGVNAAADFEERISAISAVSGATGGELDGLRDKALQLGKDTKYSATEAATAIEELVKAGLSVPDVLNGAADATVALAAAGEVALPEAATIASNAMNQFNLTAEDMVGVVDQIAGAANGSAIDVSDLGQSLQQVGAVANLAGIDFEDTATAIALMGNAGIKGSDAGTSLKSMLMRLQPTTNKQITLMQDLGLLTLNAQKSMDLLRANGVVPLSSDQKDLNKQMGELGAELSGSEVGSAKALKKMVELQLQSGALSNAFYDAKGNTKGLADISQELADSLKGMNKQQKQAALTTLFGSDAIRAAAIMSNEGAKGFNKMNEAMSKTSAADVAKTRMDNFKGSLEEMKGSLETAGIAIGTVILPPLRQLVDQVSKAVDWFLNLSDTQQKYIVAALALVSAILLTFAAVAKMIIFISKLRAAFIALRAIAIPAWLATLGPIALVVAAIAAVIAIVVLLWKHSETFRNIVLGVWNAVKAGAIAMWTAITSAASSAWSAITGFVTAGLAMIMAVITSGLGVIKGFWTATWNTFGPLVKAVFGLIAAIARLGWAIITGITRTAMLAIKTAVRVAFVALKGIVMGPLNAVKAVVMAIWGVIGGYVTQRTNAMRAAVTAAWNAIKAVTTTVWNAVKTAISNQINAIIALVTGIKDRVMGPLAGAKDWLVNAGKAIIQGLLDGITSMIGKVTDVINGITDKVSRFFPGSPVREGPLKVLNHGYAGKQIIGMVLEGMDKMARPLDNAMGETLATTGPTGDIRRARDISGSPSPRTRMVSNGDKIMRVVGVLDLGNAEAVITGIAEDVYSDLSDEDARRR